MISSSASAGESSNGPVTHGPSRGQGGLLAEIERIVEAKVVTMLKAKLGALFGE